MSLIIRSECPADENNIREVTRWSFSLQPYSNHNEHCIVDALRKASALSLSLVAERECLIIGHAAFSPVSISDGSSGWYGLGPLSVLPEFQNQGTGRVLIERGLDLLRADGAHGCVVFGNPAFYGRFGFINHSNLLLEDVSKEFFLAVSFGGTSAQGKVTYHAAFSVGC